MKLKKSNKHFQVLILVTWFLLGGIGVYSGMKIRASTDAPPLAVAQATLSNDREPDIVQQRNLEFFDPNTNDMIGDVFDSSMLTEKLKELKRQTYGITTGGSEAYLTSGGHTVIVPYIRDSDTGDTVYCMQSSADYWPNGQQYPPGSPYSNDNVLGVFYYGANSAQDLGNLARQYGLDWAHAHYGTQVALWRVLHREGYPVNSYTFTNLTGNQNLIGYIDELAKKFFSNIQAQFQLTGIPTMIEFPGKQITSPLGITADIPYHVEINDARAWITDEKDTKIKNMFAAGEKFKISLPSDQKGAIEIRVWTKQKQFATIVAQIGGNVQDVGLFTQSDPYYHEQKTQVSFVGASGQLKIQKEWLKHSLPTISSTHDLTQVKIRLQKVGGGYDKTTALEEDGTLLVAGLVLGEYLLSEAAAPEGLQINLKEPVSIMIASGETLTYNILNHEKVGGMKIVKSIKPSYRSKISDVAFDLSQVQIQVESVTPHIAFTQKYFLLADGTLDIYQLPIGTYKVTEIAVSDGMKLNPQPIVVVISQADNMPMITLVELENTLALATIKIHKKLANPTNVEAQPVDYTQIQVTLKSISPTITYEESFYLAADGTVPVSHLPFATYEITETKCPDYLERDLTVKTVVISEGNREYSIDFTNTFITATVKIRKKNSEGGTVPTFPFKIFRDIQRFSDGTPKVFQIDPHTREYAKQPNVKGAKADANKGLYHQGDMQTQLFGLLLTTGEGSVTTLPFPYQFKHVWVQEAGVTTSDYLNRDYQPKMVTLQKEKITEISFINIIKNQAMIQVHKTNEEKQKVMATFDIFLADGINDAKTELTNPIYIESFSTNTVDGIGRSTLISRIDVAGKTHRYFIREQSQPLYVTDGLFQEVTDKDWHSGKSIFTINIQNVFKHIHFRGTKVVADNDLNRVSDGAEFTLYNNKKKEIAKAVVVNDTFIFQDVRIDKLTSDMTYKETKFPIGTQQQEVIYPVTNINLSTLKHNEVIDLQRVHQPLVNAPTEIEIVKKDKETGKLLCGAEFKMETMDEVIVKQSECHENSLKNSLISGLKLHKKYHLTETRIPAGYQQPKNKRQDVILTEYSKRQVVVILNEQTEVIYHKLEGTEQNSEGKYVVGAKIGIRLIAKTNEEQPIYTSTDELTQKAIHANVGETFHQFVTDGNAYNIKGIPIGYQLEFHEIAAPQGYQLADPVQITIPQRGHVIVNQYDDLVRIFLPQTGENNMIFLFLAVALFVSGSMLVILLYVQKVMCKQVSHVQK